MAAGGVTEVSTAQAMEQQILKFIPKLQLKIGEIQSNNYYHYFLAISSLLHLMAFNNNLIIVLFSGYVMTEMCSSPSKANDYFKSKMVNML